jgi:hypothetical protein
MLDIPCGDFLWMQQVDLSAIDYTGADVISPLMHTLEQKHGTPRRRFTTLDLVTDKLPPTDLVFCRDCLVHLSEKLVKEAVNNLRRSGSTYLLATTFPTRTNQNIITGQWRPINLCAAPFNFPSPLQLISEDHPAPHRDKSLGLWRIKDLPSF